jgi:hypothetical protein
MRGNHRACTGARYIYRVVDYLLCYIDVVMKI